LISIVLGSVAVVDLPIYVIAAIMHGAKGGFNMEPPVKGSSLPDTPEAFNKEVVELAAQISKLFAGHNNMVICTALYSTLWCAGQMDAVGQVAHAAAKIIKDNASDAEMFPEGSPFHPKKKETVN
jgi:hypothetical protein